MINDLQFFISTFRSVCAVPSEAVFSSYLMLFFLYCVQVFFEWFWECSNWLSYYGYHFSCTFHILLFLLSSRLLPWSPLYSWNSSVYWQTSSSFTTTDYDFFFCEGYFFQFSLIPSLRWLPYFHDFFPLTLIHAQTSVSCQILPLSPFIC